MNKYSEEELIRFIYQDTKTVPILDEFEKANIRKPKYERLVIRNGVFVFSRNGYYFYHYVIERSRISDCVGDITFTQFKKGNKQELKDHVQSELEKIDINQYKDTTRFFRFTRPYRLRAQHSGNRTGYGWEWDWSGGVGSYTPGTEYGETTDYVFAGVYITVQ